MGAFADDAHHLAYARWGKTTSPPIEHRPAAIEILSVGGVVVDVGRRRWLEPAT